MPCAAYRSASMISYPPNSKTTHLFFLAVIVVAALVVSCTSGDHKAQTDSGEANALAGTWVLASRIDQNGEAAADERQMKLTLQPDSTFQARYRGLPEQDWILAGKGAFSYKKPLLSFFWESGATVTFLVVGQDQERMVLHHGRNLAPLKKQEPDEVFVREGAKKETSAAKPS